MRQISVVILAGLWFLIVEEGLSQGTVFSLFQKETAIADTYFNQHQYQDALERYHKASRKYKSADVHLKIARCHYFLKQYQHAVSEYEQYEKSGTLLNQDLYYYAEALVSSSQIPRALDAYRKYQSQDPEDPVVTQKIWRLDNIQYVYEDSIHYSVRPVSINTDDGEVCAVPYGNSLLFLSNRKEIQVVEKVDGSRKTPFYRTYQSELEKDSVRLGLVRYGSPVRFDMDGAIRLHAGPVAFYSNEIRMVYTKTSDVVNRVGGRSLQLFFAEQQKGSWTTTGAFPFNSTEYSITDPSISEDGRVLYFSSDKPGGFGGMDLYRSEFKNGRWTTPENLGDVINTANDETSPYLHRSSLYFSSNGHPGIGGLDIFRSQLEGPAFGDVQIMGFPMNSPGDDFGLTVDSTGTYGYLTSNRRRHGFDDDIYEFEMDLQSYPLTIEGLLQFKEYAWSDSADLAAFANAKIELIDNVKNVVVFESMSADNGDFSIIIPKFSSYRIRVVGTDGDEHVVSLDIPKHKREHSGHNIVIVKDAFRSLK
jgi:tetratricopeptide (TPR) repeat protein